VAARRVRIYQEDWLPFQNLPAAVQAFEAATGIGVDLAWDKIGVGTIEHMFDQMARSFGDDDPPFDLVCMDDVMLRAYARRGRVLELDGWMARDGITLADYTPETVDAATYRGSCIGLPCVNVSSMLLYRRDLLERYSLPVPASWDELRQVGTSLQEAVRRDTGRDFWGFMTRGAGGGGHSVWTIGCFLGSFGARWLDETGRPNPVSEATVAALACYADLLEAVAPPDQPDCSFVEMRGAFAEDRVGIIMDVGMEYAHVLAAYDRFKWFSLKIIFGISMILMVRVWCEILVVAFNMANSLKSIEQKIDALDTQAVIDSDALFEKLCRVISLTERRGMQQVEILLAHPIVRRDPILMRIFRIIERDEPSHWAPYDGWLAAHGRRSDRWWERWIDRYIHGELLALKLPFLFLNPWLARRTDWAHAADGARG